MGNSSNTGAARDPLAAMGDAALLEILLRYSSDGINVCRLVPGQGRRALVLCNDRYVEMSGRTRAELMAVPSILALVRSAVGVRDYVHRKIPEGKADTGFASWIRPDGKENYYEYVASKVEMDGQWYSVGIDRDVTEQVKADRKLEAARLRLVSAREEERRRLGRELHDGVGQQALAILLALEQAAAASADADSGQSPSPALARATEMCRDLARRLRDVSHRLYPPTLEMLGLPAALRQLAAEHHGRPDVTVKIQDGIESVRLSQDIEIALYRIAQEVMTNAVRHAQASNLCVNLEHVKGVAMLMIEDDGVGFDPAAVAGKGIGLQSMRERAHAVGGGLEITSAPGRTLVFARIPLRTNRGQLRMAPPCGMGCFGAQNNPARGVP